MLVSKLVHFNRDEDEPVAEPGNFLRGGKLVMPTLC